MKCANCSKDSLFEYRITLDVSTFYCESHLPKFLEERKRAGLLGLTEKFVESNSEAIETLTFKPLVVEEVVEEKPKPKKKASKKKAE